MRHLWLWGAALVVVLAAAGSWYIEESGLLPTPDNGAVACTMEAKLCPDGSYVGRTGPTCEFAPCPTSSSTSTVEATFAAPAAALGTTITPLAVVEDSRCPTDVQCIQAGTVRLSVRIVSGLGTSTATLSLGQPMTTEAESITLIDVHPTRLSTRTIANNDYVFVFSIAKRPANSQ